MLDGVKWIFVKFFSIFKYFWDVRGILPKSFAGLFIISTFFINLVTSGPIIAIQELAKSVLGADKVIQENVTLAINGSAGFTINEFVEIWVSVMIIWYLIKFVAKMFQEGPGGQSKQGCYVYAVFVVILIEYCAIATLDRDYTFIPLWDGLVFLILNLGPVFQNVQIPIISDLFLNKLLNNTPVKEDTFIQNASKIVDNTLDMVKK